MKLTVTAVPVVFGRFEITIKDPGAVHYMAFEKKPTLVMTAGTPDFEEVPVLFVEASPDMPARKHRYNVLRHGEGFDVEAGERAEWRATSLSAKGQVVHVFEVIGEAT